MEMPACQARAQGKEEMTKRTVYKFLLTVLILVILWAGLTLDRHHSSGCSTNCPPEISASQR